MACLMELRVADVTARSYSWLFDVADVTARSYSWLFDVADVTLTCLHVGMYARPVLPVLGIMYRK